MAGGKGLLLPLGEEITKRQHLVVVALVLLAHAIEHTYGAIMPVLFPSIMEEFDLNYTQIGLLASSYLFTLSFLQLFAGFLSKRFLRKVLIGIGMIWVGLTTFASGLARGFQELVSARTMSGVGSSVYHPLSGSFLTDQFGRSSRGRIMGLHLAVGNIGSTIAPILAGFAVLIVGWRSTLQVFAAPGIAAGLLFLLFVREKRSSTVAGLSSRRSLVAALRRRETLMLIVVETLLSFRSSGVAAFLPGYLKSTVGFPAAIAATFFSVMYAGSIPGPITLGYLSDRIGRRRVAFFANTLSALAVWLLAIARLSEVILVDLIILGIVAYSAPAIIQAFLGDVVDPPLRDSAFSLFFAISMTLGYSLAPAVLGIVIDKFGFQYTYGLLGAISLLAGLLVLLVKEGAN